MQGIDSVDLDSVDLKSIDLARSGSRLSFDIRNEPLDLAHAQGRLQHSIATTLCVIAAARAERQAAPVHAARQQLAAIYGETRLRRRMERETSAA